MLALPSHEFTAQFQQPIRQFDQFNTEFVVSLLADIHSHFPAVRELIFHGHELRQPHTLRAVNELQSLLSPYTLNQYGSSQPDQWMSIDLFSCSAVQFAEILRPYASGMLYVPQEGTSAVQLGNLIIQQTCGPKSIYQSKTYRNFLCLDVFLAMRNGYYVLRTH